MPSPIPRAPRDGRDANAPRDVGRHRRPCHSLHRARGECPIAARPFTAIVIYGAVMSSACPTRRTRSGGGSRSTSSRASSTFRRRTAAARLQRPSAVSPRRSSAARAASGRRPGEDAGTAGLLAQCQRRHRTRLRGRLCVPRGDPCDRRARTRQAVRALTGDCNDLCIAAVTPDVPSHASHLALGPPDVR